MARIAVWSFVLGLAASAASAAGPAKEPIVTDRPTATASPLSVPRGAFQVETGWRHARVDYGAEEADVDVLADFLARVGVGAGVEVRVGVGGYVFERRRVPRSADPSVDGLSDGSIGAELELFPDPEAWSQAALIVGTTVPIGGPGFTTDEYDPSAAFAFAHELTDRLSIGYDLGVAWFVADGGENDAPRVSDFTWSAVVGFAATERFGAFVEGYGRTGLSARGGPSNFADGGVPYRITDRLQLDAFAGSGLGDSRPDVRFGIGLSARFGR